MVFWPDQQGAVYAVCSDSVGGGEFPPRKNRLQDVEPMRHPLHAGKERGLVHLWLRRTGKTEYDFRLDAWLGKSGQAERCCIAQVVQSRFIDVAPYRGIDFVFLPDRPVGKTDFAADALLARSLTPSIERRGHPVRIAERQAGRARAERQCLVSRARDPPDFI